VVEFAEWLAATPLNLAIQSRTWLTPLLQSIHIVMIGVVFGRSRDGVARAQAPRTDESRTLATLRAVVQPAIVVIAVTGIVLTICEPVREVSATSFWLKMTLLAIGLISAAHFGRTLGAVAKGGSEQVSSGSRFMAVATVVLWLFIIFLGRAIAYDVEVWGSWHLG
jgi:uncharacterized membrane protein